MRNSDHNQPKGSITILMVFFTMIVLFLFVFASNVTAIKEKIMSQNDLTTEKAFYAAQSCLEEGYLQLRADVNYAGGTIDVEDVSCSISANHFGADSGELVGTGIKEDKIRSITTYYVGAGPSQTRNNSTIYHILDRSGSMANDGNGCTLPTSIDVLDCIANGGVWGLRPMIFVQESAKLFIDQLDPGFDDIGIVSYNDGPSVDFTASADYNQAKYAIDHLPQPASQTNIGDAINIATQQIQTYSTPDDVKAEILLTDGVANRPFPESAAEIYAINKAQEAKDQGIIIFTIGLGTAVNQDFLRSQIASDPGYYFFAPNTSDLEDIYQQIANIITSFNISQQAWFEE
ncbi:MAG: hypothetical protein COT24_00835 [Candidatus Kerfeldbacteria bacterium CG08_land_8_20_14_0_20_40_16]|uniref:VWFA domain-containing protein n=1 Tax=Candidatus Kerfeldbacteria bacterium CG08_land_8_20_14_0_20_40_16 TaxID=2014244 RepID=A0A2H0YXB3_9BACT|nr:MAG: hypothetical protein COT24_00835 [Candidatus Kerfeldbacteria bacterium CG08_land_8_20_14_0_20_40_16]